MSTTNYVSNTSTPPQQYETLAPDGNQVTQPPEPSDEQPHPASAWSRASSTLGPYKVYPVWPDLHNVPGSCGSSNPHNLTPPYRTTHPVISDTIVIPRQPVVSNAFVRSLLTTQIWQDNTLRRRSQN